MGTDPMVDISLKASEVEVVHYALIMTAKDLRNNRGDEQAAISYERLAEEVSHMLHARLEQLGYDK